MVLYKTTNSVKTYYFAKLLFCYFCIFFSLIFVNTKANNTHQRHNYQYNYGFTKSSDTKKIYLTIDLCPNKNATFEENLFLELIKLSKIQKRAIKINIAISGLWILQNPHNLNKILNWVNLGYFDITWINHSYHHYYNKNLDFLDNFMLNNKYNAKDEIIKNDKLMRSKNLKPSVFFRFPGLISNENLIKILTELNLKPLGANSWLVKTNGTFAGGDIILIHGNGGEHLGVKLFLQNLHNNKFNDFTFESVNQLIDLEQKENG